MMTTTTHPHNPPHPPPATAATAASVVGAAYPSFRLPGDTDSEESDNGWSDRDDTEEYEDEEIVWNDSSSRCSSFTSRRASNLESFVENTVLYQKMEESIGCVVDDDYDDSSSTDSTSALALNSKHSSDNDASSSPMNVPLIVATTTTSVTNNHHTETTTSSSPTATPLSFSSSGSIMEDLILLTDDIQDPTRNYDSRYDKALSELQPLSDHDTHHPNHHDDDDDDDDDDSFETPWNHRRRHHHHRPENTNRFLKPDTGERPPTPPSPNRKKCPRPPAGFSGFTPIGSPTPAPQEDREEEQENNSEDELKINHEPSLGLEQPTETTTTKTTPIVLEKGNGEEINNNETKQSQAPPGHIEPLIIQNSDSNEPVECLPESEPDTTRISPSLEIQADGDPNKKGNYSEQPNGDDGSAIRLASSASRELPFGGDDQYAREPIHMVQTDTASTSPSSVAAHTTADDREIAKLNQLRQRDHKLIWFLALGLVCAVIVLAAIVGALVALALSKNENIVISTTSTTTATMAPGKESVELTTPTPSKTSPQATMSPTKAVPSTFAPTTTNLRRTVTPTPAPTQKSVILKTTAPVQSSTPPNSTQTPVSGSAVVP
jgi:hypothetical protein